MHASITRSLSCFKCLRATTPLSAMAVAHCTSLAVVAAFLDFFSMLFGPNPELM